MCKFTFFTYECRDNTPRPVRTSQCLLSRQGLECVDEDTHIPLTPKTCPYCVRRAEQKRKEDTLKDKVEELGLECEHMGKYPQLYADECFQRGFRAEVGEQMEWERRMNVMRDDQSDVSPDSNNSGVVSPASSSQSNANSAHTSSIQSSDPGVRYKPLPVLNWEVPTRCFIDAGFVRMDPWAADRQKQTMHVAMKRQCKRQGFRYIVPYPCPEERESIDPLSTSPEMSSLESQQRAHALRVSMVGRPVCPPGLCEVPTVGFKVALAPCCAKKTRLWRAKHQNGNIEPDEDRARDTISDDCCMSSF